jgi:hypothetical protein
MISSLGFGWRATYSCSSQVVIYIYIYNIYNIVFITCFYNVCFETDSLTVPAKYLYQYIIYISIG